ncbi:MAG: hypothetical protein M4579_000909 [Chaenotheca gracillima]|nr:MAG: hypothetical protein M4579_000909 [Chaenotheca gracillima]
MAQYGLLEQTEEDALHKSRMLNVEEKPFKRVTKRLLTPSSLILAPSTHLPTPPPDASSADESAAAQESERQKQDTERDQFREDVTLDFAAFESSIARVQFLLTSNEMERERYAAEKLKILDNAQKVRGSTVELHGHLEEARKTLAVRKTWDDLTEKKITSNRMLRTREDQNANLEKLNAEIAELERESREYAQTWAERREQFGRIMKEGMELRRLIRDEKEEVERREGMEGREDMEEGSASHLGTPRPETGGATPMHSSQDGEIQGPNSSSGLVVTKERPQARSSPLTDANSATKDKEDTEDGEDSTMAEQGEIAEDEEMDSAKDIGDERDSDREEGEEDEFEEPGQDRDGDQSADPAERMDTT